MLTMASDVTGRQKFGDALRAAMNARGVTQRDLASDLGVTQAAVSSWVNGDFERVGPVPETVFDLERRLDLPPGHLSKHLGYLPPEAAKSGVTATFESVVMDDPLLDDTQKRGVLALYREFVARRRKGR